MKRILFIVSLAIFLLFNATISVYAEINDFDYYELDDGTISISINSQERHLVVPSEIDGYTVSSVCFVGALTDLWSIKLPATVKTIGELVGSNAITEKNIFGDGNPNLCWIDVDSKNPYMTSNNGVLYNKDKTKLIAFPHAGAIGGSFTLPSSVKEIGDSAFKYCTDIGELTLRNKLEKIGKKSRLANGV